MNTAAEILQKHEDVNEYHFHEVDRKWIIEAMEEYKNQSIELPTDEEIRNSLERSLNNYNVNDAAKEVWIDGAKWMRDNLTNLPTK